MRRMHLLELHDQKWFPHFLRQDFVETLSAVLRLVRVYHRLAEPFSDWLAASRGTEVLDLASGAGGPVETLVKGLRRKGASPPRFILSDLFPNRARFAELESVHPECIRSWPLPVDATRVEVDSGERRVRSMISSFHHFEPSQARSILQDAVDNCPGIFIVEPFQRTFRHLLLSPLSVFPVLVSPFMDRKPDLVKILLTFLIPVIPLVMIVDTFVSVLRCYSEKEIREMIDALPPNDFVWKVDSTPFMGLFRTTCFFGWKADTQ